ncbi:TIGR04076 family protein [Blautia pseudococcoides]|nr:TIGR04076 family protein [Blautia pseudococcoides]
MSKNFEIEVEEIRGYCSCGYKVGDTFHICGLGTPDKPICGGAYMVLFPMMNALFSGAKFNFEKNPYSKTKLACPDNGYVVFKVTLLNENNKEYEEENNVY